MAPIPVDVIRKLSKINVSGSEWKVILYIIVRTIGCGKTVAAITLREFEQDTKIGKSHVCRTLDLLEERKMISRLTFRAVTSYSFNDDSSIWKLGTLHPKPEIEVGFERWFAKYPVPLHKDEAREAYYFIVSQGQATPEDLDKGLAGYLGWTKKRDQAFGRDANPVYFMLGHNFLKDKKYEDYAKLSELMTELGAGSHEKRLEMGGKRMTERTEKEERYWKERDELRTKLLDEHTDEIMDAEENDDIKTLQAIKAEIDVELLKFSKKFWEEEEKVSKGD